jgi:hypothetical protein
MSDRESMTFRVKYSKAFPAKVAESAPLDGFLITTPSDGWIWLKDEKKVTIRKGIINSDLMKTIIVGGVLSAAGFRIEILELIRRNVSTSVATASADLHLHRGESVVRNSRLLDSASDSVISAHHARESDTVGFPIDDKLSVRQTVLNPPKDGSDRVHVKRAKLANNTDEGRVIAMRGGSFSSATSSTTNSTSSSVMDVSGVNEEENRNAKPPSLDPALEAVMRPHQKEAFDFLLARLTGQSPGDSLFYHAN